MSENKKRVLVKQKIKTSTAEHGFQLFSSLLSVLTVVLFLGCIVTFAWLFFWVNPMTENQQKQSGIGISMTDKHKPQSTHNAIEALISAIKYDQYDWPENASSPSYLAAQEKLISCSDFNPSQFERLIALGKQTNKSIHFLELENVYGLDIQQLTSLICQQNLTSKSINTALAKYLNSKSNLLKLDWHEISKRNFDPITATRVVSVSSQFLVKESPWQGLKGCTFLRAEDQVLYLGAKTEKKDVLCHYEGIRPQDIAASTDDQQTVIAAANNEVYLPPNLGLMTADLSLLQTPRGTNSLLKEFDKTLHDKQSFFGKLLHKKENTIHYSGVDIPVGYSSELTLDPNIQTAAQKLALCATNQIPNGVEKSVFCADLMSAKMLNDSERMFEGALARRVGVAIIDVETQEIKALASSHTNCYAKDNGDRSVTAEDCVELWPLQNGGDKLLNHAVFANEAPGSTIKPTQALAIVRQWPEQFVNSASGNAKLASNISRSSTKSIVDHLTCQTYSSQYDKDECAGFKALNQAAQDVGFNAACNGNAKHCGAMDLLFGVPETGEDIIKRRYYAGRLLIDAQTNAPYKDLDFSRKTINQCLNKAQRTTSNRCNNRALANAIRDSWGRNNVKASPLGMASSFMHLMAAANNEQQVRGAHIVRSIWNISHEPIYTKALQAKQSNVLDGNGTHNESAATSEIDATSVGTKPLNIAQADASATLELMKNGISKGTGQRSCNNTLGNCSEMVGKIYGKTGTPSYKMRSATAVKSRCIDSEKSYTSCHFRPLKWYVYATKDTGAVSNLDAANANANKPWKYAVAVMVERNWFTNGVLDDTGDSDSRAAQIGLMLYPKLHPPETSATEQTEE